MNEAAHIGLVDDDEVHLRSLARLLRVHGFNVHTYASARELLAALDTTRLECLILDVSMPELSGLALHDDLRRRGLCLPVLFLTGEGDIPMSVRAIKAGAVNFLTKPVNQTDLLTALQQALAQGSQAREEASQLSALRNRFGTLTARELEVLSHVITGKPNKQIAADLGVSEQTIKVHRMRVTEKTGFTSVAELVRAADRLKISPAW
jgi:FixJ family two-component response regulator